MAKGSQKLSLKKRNSIDSKQTYPVVKKCIIDFFYYDEGAEVEIEGEVKFDDSRIVVSYELEDGGYVVYQGTEKGKGHYELKAPSVNGRATLHMFEKSKILEGYWFESDEGWSGMWRIKLLEV